VLPIVDEFHKNTISQNKLKGFPWLGNQVRLKYTGIKCFKFKKKGLGLE
jgi:hypothetical protein